MTICSAGHMAYHETHKNNALIVYLPLSKSISNRTLFCAALSGFDLSKIPLSSADDSKVLLKMLVDFRNGKKEFNAGHGGAGFRFMLALLSGKKGNWKLRASKRLLERPHDVLINILVNQGAWILKEDDGYIIEGTILKGGPIDVDISVSSQYLSALLMIGPLMKKAPEFTLSKMKVSFPYVKMTLEVLRDFGVEYQIEGQKIKLLTSAFKIPSEFRLEKDWSAAAFWMELVVLFPNLKIKFPGLQRNSLQPDAIAAEYFRSLGVAFEEDDDVFSITGGIVKKKTVHFDLKNCPDLFLPLVLACAGSGKEAVFTGISHLAYKESNRLQIVKKNLALFGIECSWTREGEFHLPGNQKFGRQAKPIDHDEDHRVAMAFAMLSLKYPQIKIPDMNCVSKSYPEFITDFNVLKKSQGF